MKVKIFSLIIAVFMIFTVLPAFASKIAFIDVDKVMNTVDEGQKILKELEDQFLPKKKEVEEETKALQEERKSLEDKAMLLKDDARAQLEKDFMKKVEQHQLKLMKYQREIESSKAGATQGIWAKLEVLLAKEQKKQKYTAILHKAAIAYAPTFMDITNEIIRTYNKQYPLKGSKKKKKSAKK